ncbi:MAG: fasciclin domain-containing protein [Aquabacterium sp.]|uniref:fasciclin domain-containing protein n=1 Tax=Aquabacterium sp. TaxID=1872578 RepID=UPI002715AF8C|nr:fasciclin domain-containing protein [Aquabacterium sp.]MDO9003454.1 fasciclin domain-containing protein [Aquabacterium sp.]
MPLSHQTRSLLATALLATPLLWSNHAVAQTASPVPTTVVVVAARTPDLSTFYKLVQQAGLTASLEAVGPVTVFAPTNEAFKAVPAAALDKLGKDPDYLKSVLTYHVVPGVTKMANMGATSSLKTLNGASIGASKAGDFVTVDEALVTQADLIVGNGVVHLIDRVLMPAVKK